MKRQGLVTKGLSSNDKERTLCQERHTDATLLPQWKIFPNQIFNRLLAIHKEEAQVRKEIGSCQYHMINGHETNCCRALEGVIIKFPNQFQLQDFVKRSN